MDHVESTRGWGAALGLAAVTGMRAALGPAFAFAGGRGGGVAGQSVHRLRGRLLGLAAAGELVGDKLPGIPDRTSPPALLGRMVSGAVVAHALRPAHARGAGGRVAAVVLGAAAALATAFASHRLRRAALRALGGGRAASAGLGAVEDLVALSVGRACAARRG